jgi:hypothetical protein
MKKKKRINVHKYKAEHILEEFIKILYMYAEAEPRGWLRWATATPQKMGNY